jgi:hypothetical protein
MGGIRECKEVRVVESLRYNAKMVMVGQHGKERGEKGLKR